MYTKSSDLKKKPSISAIRGYLDVPKYLIAFIMTSVPTHFINKTALSIYYIVFIMITTK